MSPDDETLKTSEIEGEFLNRDSLQSSMGGHSTYKGFTNFGFPLRMRYEIV